MTKEASETLMELHGRVITSVHRTFYVYRGDVDESRGAIELHFSDVTTLFLDGDPDGSSLRVRSSPWRDPFSGEFSPENRDYVERSGKWTRFDVTNRPEYSSTVDEEVIDVSLIRLSNGMISGVNYVSLRLEPETRRRRVLDRHVDRRCLARASAAVFEPRDDGPEELGQ